MAKKPSDPAVHVRMYRVGLGDCFLVTLDGASPFHMLIDCGMWEGSAAAKARMKQCVADIAKVTGGRLDILVVTHEHWDHVSGFSTGQGRDFFDRATIGRLLVAWTEDPGNDDARAIRNSTAALRMSLTRALRAAEQTGLRGLADEQVLHINGVGKNLGTGAVLGASPCDSFDWIKSRCNASPTTEVIYAAPGKSVAIPGARIHVLGPPQRLAALRKNDGGAAGRTSGESYFDADSPDALAEALDNGVTEALL
ncbi:MAG TPA: MBL fold metallo-hydrolase, partial [Phycisphaerales bacterium]|nr:MBL fold metallo-hydrolase [Phycisphaerales bacterium]